MNLIAITGIMLFFVFASAIFDTSRIKRGKPIYHGVNLLVRLVFVAVVALLFTSGILPLVKVIVYCGALFWLMFDYTINECKRKFNNEKWLHWWYLGEGAFTDQILAHAHGYTYRYLRLFLLKLIPFIWVLIWNIK